MSIERRQRLACGKRGEIRSLKRDLRKEIDLSRPSDDSIGWEEVGQILRSRFPNFQNEFGKHTSVLLDFLKLRKEVRLGGDSLQLNRDFLATHDPKIIEEIKPALAVIAQSVGKLK